MGSLKRAASTAKRARDDRSVPEVPSVRRGARPAIGLVREDGEEEAELLALGHEVLAILLRRGHLQGHALHDAQSVALDPHDLLRVVGEVAEVPDAEVDEDLRADP